MSQSLSANVRFDIQFRNQQGKVQINYNWFLGYTKDKDGKLIVVPKEAAVVQRIGIAIMILRENEFFLQKQTRSLSDVAPVNGLVIWKSES